MNKQNFIIETREKYGDCFKDSAFRKRLKEKGTPQGFVEIFETDEKGKIIQLVGKSNLVVYYGRETVMSRSFNITNALLPSGATKDEYICWLGVGSGGCPVGDLLDPTSPANTDTNLSYEIPINATDATCGDYRGGFYYKRPFDLVTYEQDTENDNSYLITRIMSTITIFDCNGYNINEAGLFTAESGAGGYSGHFSLFARITFPTIVKTSSRQLVFIWYIYF